MRRAEAGIFDLRSRELCFDFGLATLLYALSFPGKYRVCGPIGVVKVHPPIARARVPDAM